MKNTAAAKRHKIMQAVLTQTVFDGWTRKAFDGGIAAANLTKGEADLLFPQGLRDVIELFGDTVDAAMQQQIDQTHTFNRMRVRDKIAFAVRARFEYLAPHREAMRRLLIWYVMPIHASLGVKRLYKSVDLVWRAAGDSATDFNFYTKRLLLAGVMKATLLFWIGDESPNHRATWEFLDRRLGEVLRLGKGISLIKEWLPSRLRA
jgi:ubiquinone biosynthesis protein COQ9